MKFRVKDMDITTGGILVAVINKVDAIKLDLHAKDRVLLKKGRKKSVIVVDIAESKRAVPPGTIGLFEEILDKLSLKKSDTVDLLPARKPKSLEFIRKKLDGKELTRPEMSNIVSDIVRDELTESEITFFIAACYAKNLTDKETVSLAAAIVEHGTRLKINKKIILDKHCIGGVPNNRTTMLVIPIVAALGYTIPKTSSRSITSPAGTADTMEVLAPVKLTIKEMEKILKKVGCFIAWGGVSNLAAADDKLISIRHGMSLDPEGMLLASILAKKSAVESTHVLIDIPVGKDNKVLNFQDASHLAKRFSTIGRKLGMKMKVIATKGDDVIGSGVGPVLEARDVLRILERHPDRPIDLETKSINMATELLKMAGLKNARKKVTGTLECGAALTKFKDLIKAQGGDPAITSDKLKLAKYSRYIRAGRSGKIKDVHIKKLNHVARLAGAPIDKEAGFYIYVKEGQRVKKGDLLLKVYAKTKSKLKFACETYKHRNPIIFA